MSQGTKQALGVGEELSGYRLTERLGEGGMATVFRGENLLDPSIVRAIKVVHTELGSRREFVARFAIEARTLEKLSHPNVVRFFGVRQDQGRLVMELELLEGATLASKVVTGTSLAEVVAWVIQAGEGIAAAHALGVLHRDVKPDNLFLTRDGTVKVLDFGIARALDEADGATRHTAAGTTPGTAAYLAPEVWRGGAASPATDVYALGLTLIELAFGYHPFLPPGQLRRSSAQLMYAHLEEAVPLLRSVRPEASAGLEAVVAKATAREPSERYASVAELLSEFRRVQPGVAGAGAASPSPTDASTSFALPLFVPSAQPQPPSDGASGRAATGIGATTTRASARQASAQPALAVDPVHEKARVTASRGRGRWALLAAGIGGALVIAALVIRAAKRDASPREFAVGPPLVASESTDSGPAAVPSALGAASAVASVGNEAPAFDLSQLAARAEGVSAGDSGLNISSSAKGAPLRPGSGGGGLSGLATCPWSTEDPAGSLACTLYREGQAAKRAGRREEARRAFLQAYALKKHPEVATELQSVTPAPKAAPPEPQGFKGAY